MASDAVQGMISVASSSVTLKKGILSSRRDPGQVKVVGVYSTKDKPILIVSSVPLRIACHRDPKVIDIHVKLVNDHAFRLCDLEAHAPISDL